MKLIATIVLLIIPYFIYGNDYGFGVRVEIHDYYHANGGSYTISSDVGGVGSNSFFATIETVGDIDYFYHDVPDGFDEITISVDAHAIALGTFPDCTYSKSITISKNDFQAGNVSRIRYAGCNISFEFYPLHVAEEILPSDAVCLDEVVTLKSGYNWQYSLTGTGGWTTFKSATTSFTPPLSDIISSVTSEYIYFRTGYYGSYTNVAQVGLTKCSPKIIGSPTAINTTCSDNTDGRFTMIVDRSISSGDELVVGLYNSSNHFIDQASTQTLQNLGGGKYRYSWPTDQGIPGNITYYVKIQTHPKSDGSIPDDDASWHSLEKSGNFTIGIPSAVTFSATKTSDVNCHGGNDGKIKISASGGTGSNYKYKINSGSWTSFNSPKTVSLSEGSYQISVRDGNKCVAPGGTKDRSINQPDDPIKFSTAINTEPTANGFTNGSLEVTASGGNGVYSYNWSGGAGSNPKTDDIPAGTYTLTVTDNKYSTATDKTGCMHQEDFVLDEPDPLAVGFVETAPISCHSSNTYGDPSQDGELTADATGGVALDPSVNGGLDYYYTWKKKDAIGVWQVLPDENGASISFVGDGEYAVNIEDANGIILGTYANNALVESIDATHYFHEPDLLEQSINKQDVYCHGGSDGWVETLIAGGTSPYQTTWSNGTTSIRSDGLSEGTFNVSIVDDRGCHVSGTIDVLQPEDPLTVIYSAFSRPSTIGEDDGWVKAQITGGTSYPDQSYVYSWLDKDGNDLNVQTNTSVISDSETYYQIHLNDIPAGAYSLSIQDKNYASADTKAACNIINDPFDLYDPIEASFSIVKPISCDQDNEFNNPSSDGILRVNVDGGLKFSTGMPYTYHWKKKNEATGLYEALATQTSETAINLSDGEYALNVEDALGIVMGEYESNNLLNAIDETFLFSEPDPIEISLSATRVSCESGNDGKASAAVIGGTGGYDLEWSTGESNADINNLPSGFYLLYLKDEKECEASAKIEVEQPESLSFEITEQKNPTCYQGNDGRIEINVTVGQPPYTYQWSNGVDSNTIDGLSEGTYHFQVRDSKGCNAFTSITLEDPNPIIVDLGDDRTLCQDQVHDLDLSIDDKDANYHWTSDQGYQSQAAAVALSEAGIYTATVTTGDGCIGQDQIEIKSSSETIDADFLLSSQAFAEEGLLLINTSNPLSSEVEWIFPDQAEIIDSNKEQANIIFNETGAFPITLKSIEGECYQTLTKSIVVDEPRPLPDIGDTEAPFVEEYDLFPNPTSGKFSVHILLEVEAEISLRIYNMTNSQAIDDQQHAGNEEYNIAYDLQLNTGIYLLLLETPYDSEIRKIIIE